jgi:hypothetical protein
MSVERASGQDLGTAASPAVEKERRRMLNPLLMKAYMLARLPLAACAGLRVVSIDEAGCAVRLPGGWRTRNPFGSTYFAAQMMAAEMATGAVAMMLVRGAEASLAFILREVRGVFTKRVQGRATFTFADVAGMRAVIEKAAASGQSEVYVGRVVGVTEAGEPAAEFDITWSFKRRS